jgi:hypothetical protein
MHRGRKLEGKIDQVDEIDGEILTHDAVLRILTAQARKGSVSAAVALERALRSQEAGAREVDEAIDRILDE